MSFSLIIVMLSDMTGSHSSLDTIIASQTRKGDSSGVIVLSLRHWISLVSSGDFFVLGSYFMGGGAPFLICEGFFNGDITLFNQAPFMQNCGFEQWSKREYSLSQTRYNPNCSPILGRGEMVSKVPPVKTFRPILGRGLMMDPDFVKQVPSNSGGFPIFGRGGSSLQTPSDSGWVSQVHGGLEGK